MEIVRESIQLYEKAKLALISGLVIIQDNKILLAHPTGASWWKSYSIPKGHVDPGESILDAAKRETLEEVGIESNSLDIKANKDPKFVDYTDKKGKIYKRVYYFIAIPIKEIRKNDFKLQKKEVDWAGFMKKEEASKRIHPRFKSLLKLLN